jgi:hypothetical protein
MAWPIIAAHEARDRRERLTQTGAMVGTPTYSGGGVSGYCNGTVEIAALSASMKSFAVCGLRAGFLATPASSGASTTIGRLGLNFRGDGAGVTW